MGKKLCSLLTAEVRLTTFDYYSVSSVKAYYADYASPDYFIISKHFFLLLWFIISI